MKLPILEPCHHELPAGEFGTISQLVNELGHGNDPVAVMLTCFELGGVPDQVSGANAGEIMIVQNGGGLVPPHGAKTASVSLDTVVYALTSKTIRHLIVCGHTLCQSLGLLIGTLAQRTSNPFRHLMADVDDRFQSTYLERASEDWLSLIVQESVRQQLANLRSYAGIKSRLQEGRLLLHGWVRYDETSVVVPYDADSGQFQIDH